MSLRGSSTHRIAPFCSRLVLTPVASSASLHSAGPLMIIAPLNLLLLIRRN
jgi:hypothetical protein